LNENGAEFVEIFLGEASERLQFLREYSGILQDAYPPAPEVERLYIAAHTLSGTSASYGFPLFSEIAGKLAHIFQYAMNATIASDAAAPLLEFIAEAVSLLESDLIMISANAGEAGEDIAAFKQRYPFAFPAPAEPAETPAERAEYAAAVQPVERSTAEETTELGREEFPVAHVQEFAHDALADAVLPDETPSDGAPADVMPSEAIVADVMPEDDQVPAEILEFFVPEAEEHLQVVTDCLLSLETNPGEEQIHRLLRAMHTVKGSSAQVGLHRISHVAHRAEDLIGRLRDGALRPSAEIVDICLEAVDVLKKFLYHQWSDDAHMQAAVQPLFARIDRLVAAPAPAAAAPAEEEVLPLHELTPEEEQLLAEYAEARAIAAEAPKSEFEALDDARKALKAIPHSRSVRVALERLDRMMNAVGELVINRTRMIGRLAELERLADVLNLSKTRMNDKVAEFQDKYEFSRIHSAGFRTGPGNVAGFGGGYPGFSYPSDPADFSELEMDRYDDFSILSRSLTEISADISEVLTQMGGFVRRVDGDIDEFTKLAHRLQDEITQARMVPIGNLYTRLSRTVRDASKAVGKKIELVLEGAETELDNNIIQQISDPLIHLVRNAVAHGIERDEERYESGKSDVGTVTVRAYHRGNHIFVEVEDDGRGIDYEKVRSLAVERGMVYPESAAALTEPELLEMLFQPGFSTSPHKTELAGRGVGLDVVRSNIAQLNGEIDVDSEKGQGTRFTLKVPLTLIISQALFVRCGETMFAVPLAFVEEVRRVKASDIEEDEGKLTTVVRDVQMEVVRVDVTLGLEPVQPVNGYFRMVIVNASSRQVGLIVEDVVRKDEIVIKSLGEYLRKVKMYPGATIAPDGSLILLLDVNRLVAGEALEHVETIAAARSAAMATPNVTRIFAPGAEAVAHGAIPQEAIDPVVEEKVVVLADDSISVRKFVGRMLEKAGYRVKLASDGMEALEIVAHTRCDLVVTDLEMPRTNGYELLAHLRQAPATRDIPVMVVTSRAGAKHRERAMKEGAAAFLTKPVQEDHFIAAVGRLIGAGSSTPAAAVAAER
jgi:chemosensory pili system protein ChpA (sensor histidine kinase/response regulator)